MHAKTLIADSQVCALGTANLDLRSFGLNYELEALIYDPAISRGVARQFLRDQAGCREFTLTDYQRLAGWQQLRNSLARLLAPIM